MHASCSGLFLLCLVSFPAAASAADFLNNPDADYSVTAAVGVDSVGVFRGVRAADLNPSVYAFVELARGAAYGGVLATPVRIGGQASPLVLGYLGFEHDFKFIETEIGAHYYSFPGSRDIGVDDTGNGVVDRYGKKGLVEASLGVSRSVPNGKVSGDIFFTPNSLGETGPAYYFAVGLDQTLPYGFELQLAGGVSRFENDIFNDDYADFSAGVFWSISSFDMYVRYTNAYGLANSKDETIAFGIERSFDFASRDKSSRRRMRKISNDFRVDKKLLAVRP